MHSDAAQIASLTRKKKQFFTTATAVFPEAGLA